MAAPTIRGSTVPTATLAPTSPAGTQVGDMVIVFTASVGNGITRTLQGTFTQILNSIQDDATTDSAVSVAYKIATGAGAASYQAYTTSGASASVSGIVVLTAGTFDVAAPLETVPTPVQDPTNFGPNPDPPTVTTTVNDALVFAVGVWEQGGTGITAPSGYSEVWETGAATPQMSTATIVKATAGTENPGAFSGGPASFNTIAATFAVKPVAAATGYKNLLLLGVG